MKKTALYNSHIDLQAKMVPFQVRMPVTYRNINEYESVEISGFLMFPYETNVY